MIARILSSDYAVRYDRKKRITLFTKHEIELCIVCRVRRFLISMVLLYVSYLNLLRFKKRDYQSESSTLAETQK